MKIKLIPVNDNPFYGVPTCEIDGKIYLPRDTVRGGMFCASLVANYACRVEATLATKSMASRFLKQWPQGPQLKDSCALALGSMTSDRKKITSAENGKKGGRPAVKK